MKYKLIKYITFFCYQRYKNIEIVFYNTTFILLEPCSGNHNIQESGSALAKNEGIGGWVTMPCRKQKKIPKQVKGLNNYRKMKSLKKSRLVQKWVILKLGHINSMIKMRNNFISVIQLD